MKLINRLSALLAAVAHRLRVGRRAGRGAARARPGARSPPSAAAAAPEAPKAAAPAPPAGRRPRRRKSIENPYGLEALWKRATSSRAAR